MNKTNSLGFFSGISNTGHPVHIRLSSVTVLTDKHCEVYTSDSGRPVALSAVSYVALKNELGLPL